MTGIAAREHSMVLAAVCLGALVLIAGGCSNDGKSRVRGEVTLDGQPVEKGSIRFTPVDGQGPTAEAVIAGGQYETATLPGKKKVEIHGLRKLGTRHYHENDPSSPIVDIEEEIVPARYNTRSELVAELKPGGDRLDFKLRSAGE